jgi:peptide deformylase
MTIRTIVHFPDPHLRAKCAVVADHATTDVQRLIEDLFDTMYATDVGCGLAAPQIGVLLQVCVVDANTRDGARVNPLVFVNPQVKPFDPTWVTGGEGCLSLPGASVDVKRYRSIEVKHLTAAGWRTSTHDGFEARVIQHEVDHLSGKLMIDKLSKGERQRALGKINARVAELRG